MEIKSKIVATTVLLALVGTANADLERVGPISPSNGFPIWYQDHNGELTPIK